MYIQPHFRPEPSNHYNPHALPVDKITIAFPALHCTLAGPTSACTTVSPPARSLTLVHALTDNGAWEKQVGPGLWALRWICTCLARLRVWAGDYGSDAVLLRLGRVLGGWQFVVLIVSSR
jgi:hypothetical protein